MAEGVIMPIIITVHIVNVNETSATPHGGFVPIPMPIIDTSAPPADDICC